ncbi:MAG: tripartite tricarboxylate transporter TctB family protein, partial [Gemmatimonadaceae bacterium]
VRSVRSVRSVRARRAAGGSAGAAAGRAATQASAPARHRAGVALIALGMLVDVLLIDWVGFVLAGGTLFAVTAYAFGERRVIRSAAGGVAFAAAVYLVFRVALDVPLPIGRLWGGRG